MENTFVVCNNCGAKCNIGDTYCKTCSNSLSQSDVFNEQIIDGIDNAELKEYIGKNSDYYTEKFDKKKKKWFIQLNIPALLLGPTWFFYRKMYKVAIIYVVCLLLVSSLLTVLLPSIFKNTVENFYIAKETRSNYIDSGGETVVSAGDGYSYEVYNGRHPAYEAIIDDLAKAQNKIRLLEFFMTAPVFIINIIIRLFANSIYKNHIRTNINYSVGGVSAKSAIFGLIATNLIVFVVSSFISKVPAVSEFVKATSELLYWL